MGKIEQSQSTGKTGAAAPSTRPMRWGHRLLRKGMFAASLMGSLLGTGCHLREWAHNGFKVGPNYSRPHAPVADEWIDYQDPRVKSEEADLSHWWHGFKDPVLDSLIETAYQQNLSLRVAGARILESQAIRNIAVAGLFPQTQRVFGSQERIKVSEKRANVPREVWYQEWDIGFTASWELDFWGRFRRAIESADASLDASVENYDDVLVLLLSDVASNYILYRTFQERLSLARQNVVIQTQSYELAQNKFKNGATTERDVAQSKQVLEQTRALIPQLEVGLRQANNALCVLLGMPPKDLAGLLGKTGTLPKTPEDVTVGIPADLLRRRPDVRRAEREVAAQSAKIGIAKSDFYPHLALNGTLGVSAEQFWDLGDTPESLFGRIGPSFNWKILNYGRIVNNVRIQEARFQQLAFIYQDTVLRAGQDAEDAIVAYIKAWEQTARLTESVNAAKRARDITYEQYRQGAVDFTAVYLFESTLTDQQDQLAVARSNIALNLIRVYRALGGGWDMRLSRDEAGDHHFSGPDDGGMKHEWQPGPNCPPPGPQAQQVRPIRIREVSSLAPGQTGGKIPVELLPATRAR